MKKILVLFSLMFAMSISAFSQTDFSLGLGYSWLQGVVNAEAQFGHWGIGAGYFPAKMPGSGDPVPSFSGALTFYGKDNEFLNNHNGALGACYYASVGIASAGYRYQESYNGGAWGNDIVEPMTIVMGGVKSYAGNFSFKLGLGYGFSPIANAFTWEVGLQYAIFSNHSLGL